MRVYSIGAVLLDLDDPTRVRARLAEPLMVPDDSRAGRATSPTSCTPAGRSSIDDTLVMPYGIGDAAIGVAVIPLAELLDRLELSDPE